MKFEVTVKYTYEVAETDALPDYDTEDPIEMAAIDEANFNRPGTAQSGIAGDLNTLPFKVTVTPVKE